MTGISIEVLSVESRAWLPVLGVSGILLLSAGGLIVRLAAVVTGLALGGLAGWLIWSELELALPSWLIMSTCCLICIVLAVLLTRFFIATLLGVAMAIWMSGLCVMFLQFSDDSPASIKPIPTMIGSLFAVNADDSDIAGANSAHPGIELSANFHEVIQQTRSAWDGMSQPWHVALLACSIGGIVLGLLSGLFMPGRSAMLMSCLWGGLLLLSASIGFFAQSASVAGPWDSWMAMMLVWTVISAVGFAVQSIFSGGAGSKQAT